MLKRPPSNRSAPIALDAAAAHVRPAILSVVVFSFFINLLGLTAPIYMMQVYDRVLVSRSIETLVALTLIVAFLYLVWTLLEGVRASILERAGAAYDNFLRNPVFDSVQRMALGYRNSAQTQALRDLDTARDFYSGSVLTSILDVVWAPIYIGAAFLLHPLYGFLAIGSSLFSGMLVALNHVLTRPGFNQANEANIEASALATATFRNAEVLQAMGMTGALRQRWTLLRDKAAVLQASATARSSLLIGLTKYNRLLMQSTVLGLGAYLAVQREITPGTIIAGSILVGRAIQPIERAVNSWKSIISLNSARSRLRELLNNFPELEERLEMPKIKGDISVEGIFVRAPGAINPIVRGVSFKVAPGNSLGILGTTAAGKSTLARALVGVWPTASGAVRIDGTDLSHLDPVQLGHSLGYLPQDVELFDGTIAENIARFTVADAKDIIAAAELAGVHEMIQRLPEGYNTTIGEGGVSLSGGQRQRIGLARAVFGLPALIVLDEPNANLDPAGEAALAKALQKLKELRRTVIVISHRTSLFEQCDLMLTLRDGVATAFGKREDILSSGGTRPDLRRRLALTSVAGGKADPQKAKRPEHAAAL